MSATIPTTFAEAVETLRTFVLTAPGRLPERVTRALELTDGTDVLDSRSWFERYGFALQSVDVTPDGVELWDLTWCDEDGNEHVVSSKPLSEAMKEAREAQRANTIEIASRVIREASR